MKHLDMLPAVTRRAHRLLDRALRLHGRDHERTLRASRALAMTLGRVNAHAQSAELWRELCDAHRRSGYTRGAIDTHTALAVSLHAAGRCGEAIREAHHALTLWYARHPDAVQVGLLVLAAYVPMLTACGRYAEVASLTTWAHAHFPEPLRLDSAFFIATTRLYPSTDVHEHVKVCAAQLDDLLVDRSDTRRTPPRRRHRLRRAVSQLAQRIRASEGSAVSRRAPAPEPGSTTEPGSATTAEPSR